MFTKTLILGQDENSIEVFPRISARARRISIKISHNKGVELVIPKRISQKKALEFLYSREGWIIEHSRHLKLTKRIAFTNGAHLPIAGRIYKITHSGNLRGITHIDNDLLIVSGPDGSIPRKVTQFLQKLAKREIISRAQIEALKLGKKYRHISLRDTTSRWGSCSHNGTLSFSWRLIMAPREVLEYVVAHEVAHLTEMNHSKRFWQLVESIYPEHRQCRKWLKDNGATLHMYG